MRILSFWPNWIKLSRPPRALPCAVALLLLTAAFSPSAAAITHARVHRVRHTIHPLRRFTLAHFNPVFPGSHELLVQQNVELDKLQLPRINDDYELMKYELSQDLVPVSESDALKIAANLPDNRRYCRPWTRDFLEDFSQAFFNEFHQPIQVNSLVRTVEQQHTLRRHNRFAAPEFGDTASTTPPASPPIYRAAALPRRSMHGFALTSCHCTKLAWSILLKRASRSCTWSYMTSIRLTAAATR